MKLTNPRFLTAAVSVIGIVALILFFSLRNGQPPADQNPQAKEPVVATKPPALDEATAVVLAGIVVDENNAPVAGIRVQPILTFDPIDPTTTGPDGTFLLPWPKDRFYYLAGGPLANSIWLASDADGHRQGISQKSSWNDPTPMRIVLKPAKAVTVHVVDGQKKPVAGAVVKLHRQYQLIASALTGADGSATAYYPADHEAQTVYAYKSGFGFNSFSTPIAKPKPEHLPMPAEVTLELNGALSVRIRALDSAHRPVAGVKISPSSILQPANLDSVNLGGAVGIETDATGIALFDWLPTDFVWGIQFDAHSRTYSGDEQGLLNKDNPASELTIPVLRKTKISGKVVGPDNLPKAGIVIRAEGIGARHYGGAMTLSQADGTYEMLVNSECSYIVAVVDDAWAAACHVGIVVREDQPVGDLHFQLSEGTILRGTVRAGKDHKPCPADYLSLNVKAGGIPEELRKPGDRSYREISLSRPTRTDAEGNYQFRVGPGTYQLLGSTGNNPATIVVNQQKEIVQNLDLVRLERTKLTGKVVDANGKPVPGAKITGNYTSSVAAFFNEITADASGKFETNWVAGPTVLYATNADGSLGAAIQIDDEQKEKPLTMILAPTAEVQGRLLDENGKVLARRRVQCEVSVPLSDTEFKAWVSCLVRSTVSGPDGKYAIKGLIPGKEYHFHVYSDQATRQDGTLTTIIPSKAETIQLGVTTVLNEFRPPTIADIVSKQFSNRGKLSERIAKAQKEAKSHYLRVLLIVADPTDSTTLEIYDDLNHKTSIFNALLDYEQVKISHDDTEALAAIRQLYGIEVKQSQLPKFIVLGEDGKVVAETMALPEGKKDEPTLTINKFLGENALPQLDAEKLVADAQAKALKEGKRVVIRESGTYCAPCRRLSRFIEHQKTIFDPNYVFVELDRSRFLHGDEVMLRYRNKNDHSIPWCVVIDEKGKALADWDGPKGNIGFPNDPDGIDYFLEFLKKSAPRITEAEFATLRKALEATR